MDASRFPRATRRRRTAAFAAVAAIVFVASVVDPGTTGTATARAGPLGLVGFDKWVHGAAYATLALLGASALAARPSTRGRDGWSLVLVVVGVAAFGAGVEVVQSTLPVRSFDVLDVAANATGALVGVGAWRALVRLSLPTKRPHDR